MRYIPPGGVAPSEDVVNAWRNRTEEEKTEKRRALLREHYAKFAVTDSTRPPDPWANHEKKAETSWNVALQNLSAQGETLRDLEGAPA